jgi:hypothetical protein
MGTADTPIAAPILDGVCGIACNRGGLVASVGIEPQHIGLPLYFSEQTWATTLKHRI